MLLRMQATRLIEAVRITTTTTRTLAAAAATVAAASTAFCLLLLALCIIGPCAAFQPEFTEPIVNLTVPLGRDAVFRCLVHHLGGYRVGWVKADTKAIQAIHDHVITHNPRVSVSHTDHSTWNLHIHNIQEEDRGLYMCQINTDPMKSQQGVLDVVVSPDFISDETSGDTTVPEGGLVKLNCRASGHPEPHIVWRREDNAPIVIREPSGLRTRVPAFEGEVLKLVKISRTEMGTYLCIASNGIPPTISKRITVNVHFHPVIRVPNQLVGAPYGTDVGLECIVEAFPKPITYWLKGPGAGAMVISSSKYISNSIENLLFEVKMELIVRSLQKEDIGSYRCVAKNSLGEVESNIRVYEIRGPTKSPSDPTPIDDEEYVDPYGSTYQREDESSNNVAERGRRPPPQMTLGPPRATYETLSKSHVPLGSASSCVAITAATAAATTLPLLALVLFVI